MKSQAFKRGFSKVSVPRIVASKCGLRAPSFIGSTWLGRY
jgi:hypothetical protein